MTDEDSAHLRRIKVWYDSIYSMIDSFFRAEEGGYNERDIYNRVSGWSKEVDWFCNNDYPEGRRIISNKGRILRKALAETYPCLAPSGFKSKLCEECEYRFKCWTTRNHQWAIEAINKATSTEAQLMRRRKLYKGTISEEEFNKRRRKLFDYLGIRE
jgi:hypothetical protein